MFSSRNKLALVSSRSSAEGVAPGVVQGSRHEQLWPMPRSEAQAVTVPVTQAESTVSPAPGRRRRWCAAAAAEASEGLQLGWPGTPATTITGTPRPGGPQLGPGGRRGIDGCSDSDPEKNLIIRLGKCTVAVGDGTEARSSHTSFVEKEEDL